MQPKRIALAVSAAAVIAFMFAPAVMAATYTGSIQCTSGCGPGNTIAMTGPSSTSTTYYELYGSNAPSGTTFYYFVCPTGTGCSSNSGSSNGWSWTFTPASGSVGTCPSGTCEGAGYGSPSTMSLSLTAPTVVTPSNTQETLTIYACSQPGNDAKCGTLYTEVASLTVSATVPEFALGLGIAVVLGVLGLLYVRSKSLSEVIPAASTAV